MLDVLIPGEPMKNSPNMTEDRMYLSPNVNCPKGTEVRMRLKSEYLDSARHLTELALCPIENCPNEKTVRMGHLSK